MISSVRASLAACVCRGRGLIDGCALPGEERETGELEFSARAPLVVYVLLDVYRLVFRYI